MDEGILLELPQNEHPGLLGGRLKIQFIKVDRFWSFRGILCELCMELFDERTHSPCLLLVCDGFYVQIPRYLNQVPSVEASIAEDEGALLREVIKKGGLIIGEIQELLGMGSGSASDGEAEHKGRVISEPRGSGLRLLGDCHYRNSGVSPRGYKTNHLAVGVVMVAGIGFANRENSPGLIDYN